MKHLGSSQFHKFLCQGILERISMLARAQCQIVSLSWQLNVSQDEALLSKPKEGSLCHLVKNLQVLSSESFEAKTHHK